MEHIKCKVYDLYTRGASSYLGRETDSPATGFVFLSPTKQMLRRTSNQAMTASFHQLFTSLFTNHPLFGTICMQELLTVLLNMYK
jgi:hypothetical protein